MLAPGMVAEIRRLLAEGRLSQRKIARVTGISRATVGAIANGRRPDYPPRATPELFERPEGPPQRCATCGGMVYLPCRLCRVRGWMRKEERKARARDRRETAGEKELPGEAFAGGAFTSRRRPSEASDPTGRAPRP